LCAMGPILAILQHAFRSLFTSCPEYIHSVESTALFHGESN
jgi:hypothetical protein